MNVHAYMWCCWLGVSSWPIVDSVRQPNRLLGPQVPEMVMGTLFNWGNRRAFRTCLLRETPNTHCTTTPTHTRTHARLTVERQTGKVTALNLATQCLQPHPWAAKDPESAGGDMRYDL